MFKRLLTGSLLPGLLILAGCESTDSPPAPKPETTEQAPATGRISLLEDQLLEAVEMEARLDEAASRPDADELEVQRLFQDAARTYADIIARNPDHLESRLLYGKLLSRYGDTEEARDQFLMAARIDPEIAVIHQELSTYYAEEGDHTRALAYALNAIEIEPETAEYHFGLGQLLTAFRDDYITEGVLEEDQLDSDLMEAFRKAAELKPGEITLQFRLGEAYYDIADPDWEAALAHWENLRGMDGLNPLQVDAIRLHRARCLVELGRRDEAEALVRGVENPVLQPSGANLISEPETR